MIPKIWWRFLVFLLLCMGLVGTAPASLATFAYDGQCQVTVVYDVGVLPIFGYDSATGSTVFSETNRPAKGSGFFAKSTEFLAAEGPVTVGDILAGHSSDTMIHLTTATEDELATATFPNFTPPHTTPGVFQGSSWEVNPPRQP